MYGYEHILVCASNWIYCRRAQRAPLFLLFVHLHLLEALEHALVVGVELVEAEQEANPGLDARLAHLERLDERPRRVHQLLLLRLQAPLPLNAVQVDARLHRRHDPAA